LADFLRKRLLRDLSDQLPMEPRDLTGYFLTRGGRAMRQPAMMPTLISMALAPVSEVGTERGEGGELTRKQRGRRPSRLNLRCAHI